MMRFSPNITLAVIGAVMAIWLSGCKSTTDIEFRETGTHEPVEGMLICRKDWNEYLVSASTDSVGIAHLPTFKGWKTMYIFAQTEAHPNDKIPYLDSRVVLKSGSTEWTALAQSSNPSNRQFRSVEARIVGGEGFPKAPKQIADTERN